MTDALRKWFPVFLLAVLAALSYWLENKVRLSALQSEKLSHNPDLIVDGLSATKLGTNGQPKEILAAKELLHYPDDDSTKLDGPSLLLISPEKANWHLSSNWAMLSKNGADIYLYGDVDAKRDAFDDRSELNVRTDYLHYNPDKHLGETDKPVEIKDATMDVHAVGMEFNDETRIVKLLSHVRGYYEK